jgi:hypothetical protein
VQKPALQWPRTFTALLTAASLPVVGDKKTGTKKSLPTLITGFIEPSAE